MKILIILMLILFVLLVVFILTTIIHKRSFAAEEDEEVLPPIKSFNMSEPEQITYHKGDVLQRVSENISEDETRILIHICNNKGGWGAGFVLALSKKWKQPEKEYRECFRSKINFELGKIQPVKIQDNLYVINMVAQNGYKTVNNPTPLDYESLKKCLSTVLIWIDENNFTFPMIYCPKIGTGLSGGDWNKVTELLHNQLTEIPIKVYEL